MGQHTDHAAHTPRAPDPTAVEREVADLTCAHEWSRLIRATGATGDPGGRQRGEMERLHRVADLAVLHGYDALEGPMLRGIRRCREEVAVHVRGRVPGDALSAWVADDGTGGESGVVICGLRDALREGGVPAAESKNLNNHQELNMSTMNNLTNADRVELEREATDLRCKRYWDDLEHEVYCLGVGGGDHARRMAGLRREAEIVTALGEDAAGRAVEAGLRRFSGEVAELVRGKVRDETVAAWLAQERGPRVRLAVVRALQGTMLPPREYAAIIEQAGGDGWLDAAVEESRLRTLAAIESYEKEIASMSAKRQRLVEYLVCCV